MYPNSSIPIAKPIIKPNILNYSKSKFLKLENLIEFSKPFGSLGNVILSSNSCLFKIYFSTNNAYAYKRLFSFCNLKSSKILSVFFCVLLSCIRIEKFSTTHLKNSLTSFSFSGNIHLRLSSFDCFVNSTFSSRFCIISVSYTHLTLPTNSRV